MAVARPWVTPEELKAYTEQKDVRERDDAKLEFDITRAEQKVISITHNRFDRKEDETLPNPVKMAVILLAEAYAKNAVEETRKQIKSETFDDYSYTSESAMISIDDLDIDGLLEDYIIPVGTGRVVMKLRKL